MISGDIVPMENIERWVRETHPFAYYLARVTEIEQPDKQRVHVTTEITGPNGERIEHTGRRAVYYSFRAMDGMGQIEADWVA